MYRRPAVLGKAGSELKLWELEELVFTGQGSDLAAGGIALELGKRE
jgi:hypothetical protein